MDGESIKIMQQQRIGIANRKAADQGHAVDLMIKSL